MTDTITLVFNIIFLVFIFFGMFWGLIRGLKKTLSRGLFLLIISIVTLFITAPITNLLLNIPIDTQIEINGKVTQGSYTIIEMLTSVIEDMLGENFVSNYPEFTSAIASIPLILINAIAYVIIFWLLKIFLFPINVLFTKIFFGTKKRKAKAMGFSAFNEGDGPEYPNSDKSIESLMDIYNNTQLQNQPSNDSQAGLFIKKEDEIKKDAPTASATRIINIASNDTSKKQKPETKRERKKREKAELKASKPKKRRLLGALLGAVVGLIVSFNTMVPVYGILNIVSTNNNVKLENITEEEMSLSNITSGITDEVITGYEQSVFGKVSKMIGLEKLGLVAFDQVTSTQINDEKIILRDDINSLIKTVAEADKLLGLYSTVSDNGLENITQEQLTELIDGLDKVIKQSEQVKMVDSLSSYILPLAIEYIVYNEIQLTEDEVINDLIVDCLVSLAKEHEVEIFEELKTIIDLAKYLSDQDLLIRIIKNDYSNILEVIDNLDSDFGTKISEKLFNLKLVSSTLPNILNIGLTILDDVTEFGYVENNATAEELKNSFSSLITNVIEIARSLSYDSSIYVTDDSLIAIGGLLDTFRNSNLFNLETYNNLIDFVIKQVKNVTSELIPENFQETFNNHLLENVSKVTNWKTEMTYIKEAFDILRDKDNGILGEVVEGENTRQGYSINLALEEETFINIGKALDKLECSTLFGGTAQFELNEITYNDTTIISIFNSLFNELQDTFESSEDSLMLDLSEIITLMTDNLIKSNHSQSNSSTFWQDEMTNISPLIITIYDMISSGEIDVTIDLGTSLDNSANSIMLGNDTTLQLMNKVIGIVKDQLLGEDYTIQNDDSMNDQIYTLLTEIENNLLSENLYITMKSDSSFWETEITSIIALKNIADQASSITTIEEATAIASDLDEVYTSRIIPMPALNDTIALVLRQLKSDADEGVEGSINDLIEDIATDITTEGFFDNIDKTDFWQIELNHIATLTEIKFSDSDEYQVLDNLSTIGATLDTVTQGTTDTRASYLITELRVRELLATAISELTSSIVESFEGSMSNTISSVLTNITTNIYNATPDAEQVVITSFEMELGHLQTLSNLDIKSDLFSYTEDTNTLTTNLQNLGSQLDSISYNTKLDTDEEYNSLIIFDEEKNSKIITRTSISSIIISAFDMARADEDGLFNDLITNIQTSITNINTSDYVISWSRELSYVATLVQINSEDDEEFDIDNASTRIAVYIDKIAFNTITNADESKYFADIIYNDNNQIIGESIASHNNYNSVIITRSLLQSTINDLLDDFKVEETESEDNITNELIENLKTKINITTPTDTAYNNYTEAFSDLSQVKSDMETMANTVNNKLITEIDGTSIDSMLESFQSKNVSGVITTRKIALLIIDKIESTYATITGFSSTDAGIYLTELKTHYNDNITSSTEEEYSVEEPSSTYASPFATLNSKITETA